MCVCVCVDAPRLLFLRVREDIDYKRLLFTLPRLVQIVAVVSEKKLPNLYVFMIPAVRALCLGEGLRPDLLPEFLSQKGEEEEQCV